MTLHDRRPVLTRERAERFYDRIAPRFVDSESALYGKPATEELARMGNLSEARRPLRLFEFGCGSGRLAERLLRCFLPEGSTYFGSDISQAMVERARERLLAFGDGARVEKVYGDPWEAITAHEAMREGSVDCFLSTYVLDLLPEEEVLLALKAALRALKPGGVLLLAGITHPRERGGLLHRCATKLWNLFLWMSPSLVGGCRPQELRPYVEAAGFVGVEVREVPGAIMVSEALVAKAPSYE